MYRDYLEGASYDGEREIERDVEMFDDVGERQRQLVESFSWANT